LKRTPAFETVRAFTVCEPFLKRPKKAVKGGQPEEFKTYGPIIEEEGSKAVVAFEGKYVAVESTEEGFELQILSLDKQPLTPRLRCSHMDQILYDRRLKPVRAVIKDEDDRIRLVTALQQITSKLIPIADEARSEKRREEARQRLADSVLIEDGDFYQIHPAGDATSDGSFVFEYTIAPKKEKPIEKLNVLAWYNTVSGQRGYAPFDDRTQSLDIEGKKFHLTKEITAESGLENLLSLKGLKKWMDRNYKPAPREVWDRVFAFCKKYVYIIDPSSYYVLAGWLIASFFHPSLTTFPYANPLGDVEAGKTTVLRIARQLAYHSSAIGIPREASVYRSVDTYHCTLLNDEGDRIINLSQGLQDVYNLGFQKGARVPREFPLGDGRFKTIYYDAYSPKMISSRYPLPDMPDSRSIKLFMKGQPPRGIDYSQYEEELMDLKMGEPLRDDLYILRLLLTKEFMEKYSSINLYRDFKIRGREALMFRPLIAAVKAFCPNGLEEEQLIKAAKDHGELALVRKHSTREAKAVKAILAVIQNEYPKSYEALREAVRNLTAGSKVDEKVLLEELTLTNKKIHEKFTAMFQAEVPVSHENYISLEKLSSTLRRTMGYKGKRTEKGRVLKFTFGSLIHDIFRYELWEDMAVEPPEEEGEEGAKGLEQYK